MLTALVERLRANQRTEVRSQGRSHPLDGRRATQDHHAARFSKKRFTSSAIVRGGSSPAKARIFEITPGMTTRRPRIMARYPAIATALAVICGTSRYSLVSFAARVRASSSPMPLDVWTRYLRCSERPSRFQKTRRRVSVFYALALQDP